jgi:RNA polymerase sigma-70 factor (ECF subfamily)
LTEQSSASPDELRTLEQWMEQYGRDVMSTAYAYVKNYHQAQDIAQEVFLRAYTKRDTFRGESSLRTWLLAITANRCKDYLRSWSNRYEVQDETVYHKEVSAADTEGEVVAKLQRDALWNAVHHLPDKFREVISLYYIQGLSSQEVAKVLCTTEQNVRTRLHRGRLLLKERLAEGGESRA